MSQIEFTEVVVYRCGYCYACILFYLKGLKMKKLISFVLALIMLTSVSVVQFSAASSHDDVISPQSAYTDNGVTATIVLISKTAKCTANLTIIPPGTHAEVTMSLQKSVNGKWTNVQTWKQTFYTKSISFSKSKGSLSSGTYRTHASAKVYNGGVYETLIDDSSSVRIP